MKWIFMLFGLYTGIKGLIICFTQSKEAGAFYVALFAMNLALISFLEKKDK